MVHVRRTFIVDRPAAIVIPYLADFANAEMWDPGTVSCTPITEPPVQVGSEWRNVSKLLGRETTLTYTLTSVADGRVVLTGTNKTATSVDDMVVRDLGGGRSELTYTATVTFNGLAKLAWPVMQTLFLYLGVITERQMTRAIADLPAS